jgi:hypothetical protein
MGDGLLRWRLGGAALVGKDETIVDVDVAGS